MGAVKSQGFIGDSDRLTSRYGGVPVIYVESEEDHHVFGECWFRGHLSKVEFRPASAKATVSGCNGVIEAVKTERQAGNPAWGIVDRDSVMSHDRWELVYETNDAVFESAHPFGEPIKVLRRWEMESYLVDGEALEYQRACLGMQPARPTDKVYTELLGHCHALLPHAAINAVRHIHRHAGLSDSFTNRFNSRKDVEEEIKRKFIPQLPESALDEYTQHLSQADSFDDVTRPTEERVNRLLCRVHGKAMLERFCHVHKSEIGNTKLKGLLAKRIEEKERIPTELADFITQVSRSNT